MNLSEQMIECVETASLHVNDFDARSAIGMARTWVDRREPIRWNINQVHYENRDSLAAALVALMEESEDDRDAQIQALQKVREHVNAPYFNDWRKGKELLKPGDRKKEKE